VDLPTPPEVREVLLVEEHSSFTDIFNVLAGWRTLVGQLDHLHRATKRLVAQTVTKGSKAVKEQFTSLLHQDKTNTSARRSHTITAGGLMSPFL